jgi:flagella basal body P-ring formation protein FlgA
MRAHASKFRHWALPGALLFAAGAFAQEQWEPPARIETAARAFAEQHLPAPGPGRRLIVGPLDERLRLSRCDQDLSAQAAPGSALRDRLLVQVSCAAPAPWRTYVPARIAGLGRAVALKRPMLGGQLLTAADLVTVEGDAAQFPLGYYQDPSEVAGATLRRAMAGGVVLSNQMLQIAGGIARGQAVTLLADAGGVAVRMSGRAMSEAAVNQRIKVRNDSSGRIVEGIARSQQVVEINR